MERGEHCAGCRGYTQDYRNVCPGIPEEAKDIWVVIVEDHHADVDALPFSSKEQAIKVAHAIVRANAHHADSIEEQELTPLMRGDRWVLNVQYSTENDSVRVVRRTLWSGGL